MPVPSLRVTHQALKALGRYHVKADDLRALIDQSLSEDGTLARV